MIKPNALKHADKVAVIAPSSPADIERVKAAEKAVKDLGLNPIMFQSCFEKHGHLSGTDEIRAKDVNTAFSDPSIKGIICLKGGYGSPRILPFLDYENIKKNPKIFLGYSDITSIHVALAKKCDMITYHGPMAAAGLINNKDEYTMKYLEKALFGTDSLGLVENPDGHHLKTLSGGVAKGLIIGGNLSLLVSTLGSPYEIDVKDKILFIEEVHESNYKIDRMLNSLALAGKFKDCSGIILGTFSECEPEFKNGLQKDLDLEVIFNEILLPHNKPTVMNFRAGHNYPQPTLPFGTEVILDATKKRIFFTEPSNI